MSIVIEEGKRGEYSYIIRQNKDCRNYQLIIIDRYGCTAKKDYTTVNGAKQAFKRFIKNYT